MRKKECLHCVSRNSPDKRSPTTGALSRGDCADGRSKPMVSVSRLRVPRQEFALRHLLVVRRFQVAELNNPSRSGAPVIATSAASVSVGQPIASVSDSNANARGGFRTHLAVFSLTCDWSERHWERAANTRHPGGQVGLVAAPWHFRGVYGAEPADARHGSVKNYFPSTFPKLSTTLLEASSVGTPRWMSLNYTVLFPSLPAARLLGGRGS